MPICALTFFFEDTTNLQSSRRGWWKNKIGIPDLYEYLLFEVVATDRNQDKTSDQTKASRARRKKLEREEREAKAGKQESDEADADEGEANPADVDEENLTDE